MREGPLEPSCSHSLMRAVYCCGSLKKNAFLFLKSTPGLNPCIGTDLAWQIMSIHASSTGSSSSSLNFRSSSSRMRSLTTIRHLPKRFCPHLLRCVPAFLAPKPMPHILSLGEAFSNRHNVRRRIKVPRPYIAHISLPQPTPYLR